MSNIKVKHQILGQIFRLRQGGVETGDGTNTTTKTGLFHTKEH